MPNSWRRGLTGLFERLCQPIRERNGAKASITLDTMAQVEAADFAVPYGMSEREVMVGFVDKGPPPALGPLPPSGPTPRAALDEILTRELARQPCLVSFSGGRDSSALLAVALDVARRHGLPEPVPFTLRYPGNADTEEASWQQLVIDHLRPEGWEVVEIAPEAAEFLGPGGTASLHAHGLLWPPALHLETAWLSRASGATVISGEGGDEIFGTHRATSLRLFMRACRNERGDVGPALGRLAREAAPLRVRAAAARRRMAGAGYLAWLQPPLRDNAMAHIAQLSAAQPWSWANNIRSHARTPALLLGLANRDWLAGRFGARFVHPFLVPDFVDAVASHGGRFGYAGRTDAMRRLFRDLLPDPVLARSTKASFNSAFHGRATRNFARAWDGSGVDPAVVDVDVLRSLWLAERVHAGTTPLLQKAWLASAGVAPRAATLV